MNNKLTRRQFGQIAIATTTVAGLGLLANQTMAQTPQVSKLLLYGARPDSKSNNPAGVILQSFDVAKTQVQSLGILPIASSLRPGEKIIDFTSLADGTFIMAIAPTRTSKYEYELNRLVFVGGTFTMPAVSVSGLNNQQRLESLLVTNDGSLYALVIQKNGRPPVDLVKINRHTGVISPVEQIKLPPTERFSKLTQSPNGTIYTTLIGWQGDTSLVQLDLARGRPIKLAQLHFNGMDWNSGLSDLVSSPASRSNQLFALGAGRYESPNNLYTLDARTGEMALLTQFDVTKITTARV